MDAYDGVKFICDETNGLLIPPSGINVDQEVLGVLNLTSKRRAGRLWSSTEYNKGYSITQAIIKAKAHLKQVFNINRIDNKPLHQVSDVRVAQVFQNECEKIIAHSREQNDPRYYARSGILNYRENITFYINREQRIVVIFENNNYYNEHYFISCYKVSERYIKKFDTNPETIVNIGQNVTYHEEQKAQQAKAALERKAQVTCSEAYKAFYQTLNKDERMGNNQIRLVQNHLQGRNPIDLSLRQQKLVERYQRLEAKFTAFCQKNNITEQKLIV